MSKLDPRLQQRILTAHAESDTDIVQRGERVGVFVDFTDDIAELKQHGLEVESVAGKIAVGTVDLADVTALAALDRVVFVTMEQKLHLSILNSVPEIKADVIHTIAPTSYTGKGVIVGVIDTGIDFRHQAFRKPDGKTRILAIWDQTLQVPQPGESAPPAYGYGVEYTQAFIDSALDGSGSPVRQVDTVGHGTHVAGTAAGDGSQSGTSQEGANCHGADRYVGVAPEADLVVVKIETLSDKDTANAVDYIFKQAGPRPAVINMSFGNSLGPHDGTAAIDRHLDAELALRDNRAIVQAAGNNGKFGLHASKVVLANSFITFTFIVPPGDRNGDWFDLWYGGNARLQFTLQGPMGVASNPVAAPPTAPIPPIVGGHPVVITSTVNNPFNNKHLIQLNIKATAAGAVATGQWVITLQEMAGHDTPVDCWIALKTKDKFPEFIQADRVQRTSVTSTAKGVISVGAYNPDSGALADFSSRGPTIDGRTKPEITAPGVGIEAAKSGERSVWYCCDCCQDFYFMDEGTSMAAPHVAGTVALMFERDPNMSLDLIKAFISSTARAPDEEPPAILPNNDWGFGKLDATAAVLNIPSLNGGGGGGGGGVASPINPTMAFRAPFRSIPRSIPTRLHTFQQTIVTTPAGHLISALISDHFDEVYRLINTNKRIATIWHRSGGPVLVRQLLAYNGDTDSRIPITMGDNPLCESLERILEILSRYGGPSLRGDINRYGPLIAAAPGKRLSELDCSNFTP